MNEYEPLSETISVCVSERHRFGTDALLLAHFAAPRHKDRVCDLGTGCGIIPLAMMRNDRPREILGIDIQPEAVALFRAGIARSGLEATVSAVEADLREVKNLLPAGGFDVVTCNPPYQAKGSGILSDGAADQIARHETMCTITDVCQAASWLLRYGGRFCLCQRTERLNDVLHALRAADLEPKRLRLVAKHLDTAPWLFLIEGKKGSKSGMQVLPTLAVQEGDAPSEELLAIYNK